MYGVTDAEETKRQKARNLRYRKAIVKDINLDTIQEELWDIIEECTNISFYTESDDDTLINALDGNEDEAYEFKMMFSDLCAECEQMQQDLRDAYVPECFDDFFVAVGAGGYGGGLLGWDSYEQDYFGIDIGDSIAESESKKRLFRFTKAQLIDAVHVCLKVLYAYLGLRSRYDNLKAAMDILKDQNTGYLQMVKQIESVYECAAADGFWAYNEASRNFDKLLDCLPQEAWVQ